MVSLFVTGTASAFAVTFENIPSNSGSASTRGYIDPDAFTFTNYNGGGVRTIDSRYLAYECTITNSTADYVKIYTYVDGNALRSDNISGYAKIDWIDMGYDGNHQIQFVYYTIPSSARATVDMVMYSWN